MRWERLQRHHHNAAGAGGGVAVPPLDGLDGPGKRWGHTCNSVRGGRFLYIFGGYGRDNCHTNQVHVFDTETLVWKELSTMGQKLPPRAGHSTVSFGKNLFVFGGFADSQNLYNDLYMLDIESGMWTRKRLSDEIGGVVSNGDYTSRAKASRTSSKDEIDRPQVVGSHENESVMQDLKAEGSVAANVKSIVSSDASQLQESGANLEAAATLNLNDDMKVDGPNSAIDIPKEISTPTALSLNQGVNLIAMIFST
ncbi:Rab9 effector protein with kelch motifs [Linum perenne]